VRPEHIAAAARRLEGTAPGHLRPAERPHNGLDGADAPAPVASPQPWADRHRRPLYPLPFPDLSVEPGVAPPGAASYMAWRYVFGEGIGAHQRCLDIGCGTGILAVQLALNGAAHVRALDIDDRAVANTLANAFRNDVADRVTAETVDLFPWVPEERYEVIVASLYQKPTDPFARVTSHRLPDYWGRNLVDQLIAKLSEALAPEGVAYVVQLSILSQGHTADALAARGFVAQAVDYTLFSFPPELEESRTQIGRVEELSDAYHLAVGEEQVMVAYLLEVRHAR
jgi:SAM-dependent methyltransferase